MLGYTFPKSVVSKLRLQNLRIYASGQNVFCITKYSGYDPESTTYENTLRKGLISLHILNLEHLLLVSIYLFN